MYSFCDWYAVKDYLKFRQRLLTDEELRLQYLKASDSQVYEASPPGRELATVRFVRKLRKNTLLAMVGQQRTGTPSPDFLKILSNTSEHWSRLFLQMHCLPEAWLKKPVLSMKPILKITRRKRS
jgi:hypothetical protein